MGYYSTIEGQITFDPPLPWSELQNVPGEGALFYIPTETEESETPDGTLVRKYGNRIVPRWTEEVKAYDIATPLAGIIACLEGRTFDGEFRIEGEEQPDIRRAFVKDGCLVIWTADIVWPDGTREQGRFA